MKQFFKMVGASAVGFILANLIFISITFAMIGALISSVESLKSDFKSDRDVKIEDNTVLKIDLSDGVLERTSDNPLEYFSFDFRDFSQPLSLRHLLSRIEGAAEDDRISGIYLNLSVVMAGNAQLDEVLRALRKFKESGKFIYAYSEVITQKNYLLSSVADSVFLHPEGMMTFGGFSSENAYLKGMFDKLDIEPKVIRVGKYKSAGETFDRSSMSDENREQIASTLNDLYDYYLGHIAENRGVSVERLKEIANNYEIRSPETAVSSGLIDALRYEDEVRSVLQEEVKVPQEKDLNIVKIQKYRPEAKEDKKEEGKVALVYALGEIMPGKGSIDRIGSETMVKAIRKARKDDDVKAIVVRVNSPGGSALASDVILRELALAKEKKPVVISMGNVAASGGYYIAAKANRIFAQPNTITGSIGVIAFIPNLTDFWKNKTGIEFDRVRTGPYADLGNVNRKMTDEEEEILQTYVNDIYGKFVGHVADGRDMDRDAVHDIAQGRIWTGNQALENGLVDELGGMQNAIAFAAKEVGLSESPKLDIYPKFSTPFDRFFADFSSNVKKQWMVSEMGEQEYRMYQKMKTWKEFSGILAIMPYELD